MKKYHGRFLVPGGPGDGRQRPRVDALQDVVLTAPRVFFRAWGLALVSMLLLGAVRPAPLWGQIPGSYQVDTRTSRVQIHLFRGGFLRLLGSDHLIALTHFSGMAQLLPDKPWWVRMLGEATSLTVLDPWASPSDRRDVADTMLGPSQLDVKHYPAIRLRSSSILPGRQPEDWRLVAQVTLHGVTRQVAFPLDCRQDGDHLRVRGKTDLNLRDFNIQPLSVALGAYKVKDVFEVTYDITFKRNP